MSVDESPRGTSGGVRTEDEHGHYGTGLNDRVDLVGGFFPTEYDVARHRAPEVSRAGRVPSVDAGRRRAARRRRGRIITLLAVLVIVAVGVAAVVIVRKALDGIGSADYQGTGTGKVVVQVHSGDTSADIAATLRAQDVVASTGAFTAAARRSGHARDFQAGWFQLRQHMSGAAAVTLLLERSSRISNQVTVTEGMIEPVILKLLSAKLKLPLADFTAAVRDTANLGLPVGYGARSAEGFLTPQTYDYDPDVTAAEALQDMTSQFQAVSRKLGFVAAATALRVTPYQALTVASLIEAEARFEADRAKVARVVYNRLVAKTPLQFDSTSAYGLKILGLDPAKVTYQEHSPYNTRNKTGLPPTPIGNPGEKAMAAAVHPAPGNWLYFVSQDKAGHLFFTNSNKKFEAAAQRCRVKHWGCT